MRKILTAMLMFVVLATTLLTGCNLYERDNALYLAQVVAKSGNVTVTMEDLLTGYNSFGYQYIENNGMNGEEAIEKTIDDLIKKKYVLEFYEENIWNDSTKITQDEKNQIIWAARASTVDYINEQISSYEDIIKTEWKIENSQGSPNTPETNETYIYSPYVSEWQRNEQTGVIELKKPTEDENKTVYTHLIEFDSTSYTSIGAQANATTENKKIFNEAKLRFFNQLKKNYKDRGVTNKSNDELLKLEIERVDKINLENQKLAHFQEYYENVILQAPEKQTEIKQNIYDKFKDLYNTSVQSYSNNIESYYETMKSSTPVVQYYHPVQNEYFYVTHILIPFNDEVSAEIAQKKTDYENGKTTYESYLSFIETKQSQIQAKARDPKTGLEIGNYKSATEILLELQAELAGGSFNTKLNKFRDFVYKYNTDPGVLNAAHDYIIPMDSSRDQMVTAFANSARTLRGNGSTSNLGKISGLILTEYGYHIIMYTGEIPHFNLSENVSATIEMLFETKIKADGTKTYFDEIYELVKIDSSTSYNEYLDGIIKTARHNVDVKLYKTKYNHLYS